MLHLIQKENVRDTAQLGKNVCLIQISPPSQEVFRQSFVSPLSLLPLVFSCGFQLPVLSRSDYFHCFPICQQSLFKVE